MEGRKGTIFTVFSTAYAVGKSLIAVNIAAELAKQGLRVCLVDLDLQFGDICYYLKLHPKKTIADAQRAMRANPRDTVAVEYLTKYTAHGVSFDVLTNPKLMEEAYNMDNGIIRSLVQQLQLEYDYVIIDTTSTFSALNLSMMDLSTLINFVGIVDFIPTIKNMKRGSDTLKELGYDDSKIRYLLNRNNAKPVSMWRTWRPSWASTSISFFPMISKPPRILSKAACPLCWRPGIRLWRRSSFPS